MITLASVPASGADLALIAFAAFLPFLLSFGSSLLPSARVQGPTDFFLCNRSLDTGTFVTGTVGYSMQVASIYLFLLWYQSYGPWAFLIPLAWFAGYVLLAALVRFKVLDDFLKFESDQVVTIHGYVAKVFGKHRWLGKLLAVVTLVGLGGTMLAEVDYGLTNFVFPALTLQPPTGTDAIVVFSAVLLTAGLYIMWGGYKAAIKTDTTQVKVAWILLAMVMGALGFRAAKSGNLTTMIVVSAAVLAYCAYACWLRWRLEKGDKSYATRRFDQGIFVGVGVVFVIALICSFLKAGTPTTGNAAPGGVWSSPGKLQFGFGAWGLLALVVTNALWQLIDVSALQRLQSIQFDPSQKGERKKLARGLIAAGVEGTGSWFLVILLAVLATACGVQPSAILSGFDGYWWITPIFLYVVVAFMLSTLDTLIAGSAYVVHYDWTRQSFKDANKDVATEMRWARVATLFSLLVTAGIYGWIRSTYPNDQVKVGAVLYAIYAIQASIFGPVFVSLVLPKRANVLFAVLGLLAGIVASFFTTVGSTNPWFGMPADSWYVFPPFAALTASATVSFVGCWFRSVKK